MLCHPPSEPKFQGRYPLHTAVYDYLFVKKAARTITRAAFFMPPTCRTYQKRSEILLSNFGLILFNFIHILEV